MDKIEVGEWVRTVDGKFGIFDRYSSRKSSSLYKSPFNCFIKLQNRKTSLQCHRNYIKTHSKNKIDIVEVGDYVNGKYVEKIEQYKSGKSIVALIGIIDKKDIKDIVSHEQFESVKYNFEEEE